METENNISTEEMRDELKTELREYDLQERSTGRTVAPAPVVVPDQVVGMVINMENALILSALTKNSSAAIKEAAREALKPDKDDIAVVKDLLNQVIARYAPTAFSDPFYVALTVYGTHVAIKVGQVKGIVDAGGRK